MRFLMFGHLMLGHKQRCKGDEDAKGRARYITFRGYLFNKIYDVLQSTLWNDLERWAKTENLNRV